MVVNIFLTGFIFLVSFLLVKSIKEGRRLKKELNKF